MTSRAGAGRHEAWYARALLDEGHDAVDHQCRNHVQNGDAQINLDGARGFLTRLQCDELQGYLYARPMPERDLRVWVLRQDMAVMGVVPEGPSRPAAEVKQAAKGAGRPITAWSELDYAPLLRQVGR